MTDLVDIAKRRRALVARAARERQALARGLAPLAPAATFFERSRTVLAWLRERPFIGAAGIALALAARPRSAWRMARWALSAWQAWRWARQSLPGRPLR
jgi:hypothetical protein